MLLPVPGYNGDYLIDYNLNEIFKVLKYGKLKRLKPYITLTGHLQIGLTKNKSRKTWGFHQLVMLIKKGPCPKGMEVCHNDGNPQNNNPCNLRYDTRSENQRDSYKHGRVSYFELSKFNKGKFGELHACSKKVNQYSREGIHIKLWMSVSDASRELGIQNINISQTARGLRNTAGGFIWKYE